LISQAFRGKRGVVNYAGGAPLLVVTIVEHLPLIGKYIKTLTKIDMISSF